MSAWFDALGSCWIALGAYTMWRDSRVLVAGPYRRGELSKGARRRRRKALTSLRFSLFCIVSGVVWIAGWYAHQIIAWLIAGYAVVLITYDLSAWGRSSKKSKSSHAAELS
jgi:fatty acid desaturase